ncbi:hypothetical protein M885DRAFT_497651 [Pelagophyceae sp. CCMP2097]|nr:hypothetical protein M885DRAFT_497651 [Pelagophyceae sp. CCMP2097]
MLGQDWRQVPDNGLPDEWKVLQNIGNCHYSILVTGFPCEMNFNHFNIHTIGERAADAPAAEMAALESESAYKINQILTQDKIDDQLTFVDDAYIINTHKKHYRDLANLACMLLDQFEKRGFKINPKKSWIDLHQRPSGLIMGQPLELHTQHKVELNITTYDGESHLGFSSSEGRVVTFRTRLSRTQIKITIVYPVIYI